MTVSSSLKLAALTSAHRLGLLLVVSVAEQLGLPLQRQRNPHMGRLTQSGL